ncbi:MAG TPA: alpha/beta hydrolase [Acidimicrobiales bacterium]|nr:alpha/beta hydrolase [Acidimicrobiales bacterium]
MIPSQTEKRLRGGHGLMLAATRYGASDRPPVVFLHGAGQTRHAWAETAGAVAGLGWQAICVDHRGHGDSDWPDGPDYDFDHYADDIDEILEQLDEPPVMVGASLGGIAILVSHGRQPAQRYRGVVLVDITPRIDLAGAKRILGFMAANPEGFATLEEASARIAEYTGRPRPDRLDGLAQVLRQDPRTGRWRWHWDQRFLHGRLDGHALDERTTELHQRLLRGARTLMAPTLLVRGGRSELVTPEAVDELVRAVPHARTVDVAGAGHMVAGDANDPFTAAVCEFISSLR